MSDDQTPIKPEAKIVEKKDAKKPELDSFGNAVEKSPWGLFAMLQIPLVIIMALILYFMYQAHQS